MDENNARTTPSSRNAYVTLLTRPSYLAGAILLAYTLHKHSPNTPLIIAYTPDTFPETCLKALEAEAKYSKIILQPVEHLRLPQEDGEDNTKHGMVAERFIDTWTKLRVFDFHSLPQKFERMCWLDADMMVFQDPSPLIFNSENDAYIHGDEDGKGLCLMATHVCVCNLDHDSWAPKDWTAQNCAFTHLSSPSEIPAVKDTPSTFSLFNSGTFLFAPSQAISDYVKNTFDEMGTPHLRSLQFPDQDFLIHAFKDRWASLSWKTNALKTWRYWHTNIWRDDQVAVLHYIVDKPWVARVKSDGTAGYLGKDGGTHRWWWDEFDRWHGEREGQGEKELLETVAKYVAGEKEGEENEEMRAIGGKAQDYAKNWNDGKAVEGQNGNANGEEASFGPVLRKKMLGERGHGPVVHARDLEG